jgi:hypothetical protein
MPTVFIVGTITIFLTRYTFYFTHPHYFVNNTPSISRTGAFAPSGDVLMVGLCFVSLLGLISWSIALLSKLEVTPKTDRLGLSLAWSATIFAWLAEVFLALLAIIDSTWNGPLHESFSIIFFLTQIISFFLETLWLYHSRRRGIGLEPELYKRGSQKIAVTYFVSFLATIMLILYLTDKSNVIVDESLIDLFFVILEYTVSTLCFAYPLFQRRELIVAWAKYDQIPEKS